MDSTEHSLYEEAVAKFQSLQKVYTILGDPERQVQLILILKVYPLHSDTHYHIQVLAQDAGFKHHAKSCLFIVHQPATFAYGHMPCQALIPESTAIPLNHVSEHPNTQL
eukprot:1159950-Pelagomonas_calceolata.AAC.9